MPDIYSKIAAKHDPDARAWLVSDALATARRGLPLNALTTADIDAFQAIMAAEGSWPFLIEAAARTAEVRLTASVVVAGIGQCLWVWTEGGREALTAWEELPELGLPDYDAAILIAAHGLVRSVALFEPEGEGAAAARAALALAAAFAAADRADDAVAAAFTAGNLATLAMSAGEELRASEVLLRHAITADHHEAASVALSRRAYALSRMDKSAQLLAFDAVAAALRHLPNDEQNRRSVATELGLAVDGAEHLAKYKLFLWTAFADVADGEARDLQEQARMAITPVWHLGLTELARQASMITRGAIELERARERLLGDAPADATFASWNTLSFEHPAYRDAIPHGHSVQQERDFDLILLTVGHEMTHVLSMLSGVGIAVVALRAAAAELEATLGTSASRAPDWPAEFLAPLDTTDVLALAQAEQAMDIARKRQILQATWLPWFEGIAVFGELAADPTAEEDTSSDVGQVLVNFIDDVPPDDDLDAIVEWPTARRLAEETRYAGTQRAQGRFQLRRYLDDGAVPSISRAISPCARSYRAGARSCGGHCWARRHTAY